jgi:hypothetical protein
VSPDVRRFVAWRFRLLEAPISIPVNLLRVWRDLYECPPPFHFGAVAGWSFLLPDGARGVKVVRPDSPALPEAVQARLFSLLRAKHRVDEVRIARAAETPDLTTPDRLPLPGDSDWIEEWPTPPTSGGEIVAELLHNPGIYISLDRGSWSSTSNQLEQALVFTDAAEADAYVETLTPRPAVLYRYLAGARAEADQRDCASLDGKLVW